MKMRLTEDSACFCLEPSLVIRLPLAGLIYSTADEIVEHWKIFVLSEGERFEDFSPAGRPPSTIGFFYGEELLTEMLTRLQQAARGSTPGAMKLPPD